MCRYSCSHAIAVILLMTLPLSLSCAEAPALAVEVKDGPGKEQFLARCSDCHALTEVVSRRKTRQAWKQRVREMIELGAKVPADEIELISDYLAAQYGI